LLAKPVVVLDLRSHAFRVLCHDAKFDTFHRSAYG
jgi:hypothetical protein